MSQGGREGLELSLNRQEQGSSEGLGSRDSSMVLARCGHGDE